MYAFSCIMSATVCHLFCLQPGVEARYQERGGLADCGVAPRQMQAARCAGQRSEAVAVAKQETPNLASQRRVAFSSMAWNTGSSSPGELEMTLQHLGGRRLLLQRLGRCFRASARSRLRALSSFSRSLARALRVLISVAWDASDAATRVPAFVPVERSLRPPVRLFAPLRDKVTPAAPRSAQALLAADL